MDKQRLIDVDALIADIKKNNNENFEKSDWSSKQVCELLEESIKMPHLQPKSQWISVDERLPECETEVFVLAVSSYGNKTVTTAIYEDGKMPEDESAWSWEDVEMDYNEETDQYIIPCGWWEYRHYGEYLNFAVDDKVTHWMSLPELPKEGAENG